MNESKMEGLQDLVDECTNEKFEELECELECARSRIEDLEKIIQLFLENEIDKEKFKKLYNDYFAICYC